MWTWTWQCASPCPGDCVDVVGIRSPRRPGREPVNTRWRDPAPRRILGDAIRRLAAIVPPVGAAGCTICRARPRRRRRPGPPGTRRSPTIASDDQRDRPRCRPRPRARSGGAPARYAATRAAAPSAAAGAAGRRPPARSAPRWAPRTAAPGTLAADPVACRWSARVRSVTAAPARPVALTEGDRRGHLQHRLAGRRPAARGRTAPPRRDGDRAGTTTSRAGVDAELGLGPLQHLAVGLLAGAHHHVDRLVDGERVEVGDPLDGRSWRPPDRTGRPR